MEKRRSGWKFAALLMAVSAFPAILRPRGGSALINLIADLAVFMCTLGLIQYAFGRPRLPRTLWRIFGPIIALFLIGTGATAIGWLGTRLAIRPLTLPQQVSTAAVMAVVLGYTLMIVIPLLRLGEWRARGLAEPGSRQQRYLGGLEQTFS